MLYMPCVHTDKVIDRGCRFVTIKINLPSFCSRECPNLEWRCSLSGSPWTLQRCYTKRTKTIFFFLLFLFFPLRENGQLWQFLHHCHFFQFLGILFPQTITKRIITLGAACFASAGLSVMLLINTTNQVIVRVFDHDSHNVCLAG